MQKCPFDAIMIINLPKNLEKETTHRYGPNSFKLHRCAPSRAPQECECWPSRARQLKALCSGFSGLNALGSTMRSCVHACRAGDGLDGVKEED